MTQAANNPPARTNPATSTVTEPPAFYMGVVFELNGKEVSLEPLTPINYISKTGLECRLDEPVPLGEIGENLKSVLETVGASPDAIFEPGTTKIKQDIKDIPVVGEIVETLLEADVTITQFYVKIPPKGSTSPVRYTVGMSAVWNVGAGKGRLFGNVYLKGLYLKVSNEDVLLLAASSTPQPANTQPANTQPANTQPATA